MKNGLTLLLFVLMSLTYACNNAGEKATKEAKEPVAESSKALEVKKGYTLSPSNTKLAFTAYKTTEKIPVKGVFQTLNFEEKNAEDLETLLNGLNFSIPVSSLFTDDATQTRDPKIKESFFGAMLNTELLSGKILVEDAVYVAEITMNDATNRIELEVNVSEDNVLTATGTVNLADWNALGALASLNEACFDLHKASDGVSKTWEDVAVEITAKL